MTHIKRTKHLKQFTALLLSGLMALSSLSTAFALGGSAQGNDTSGVPTGSGGDFSANITGDQYSGKIGVRLSLVNRNNPSEVISKGYDNNNNMVTQVVDLLYVTPEAFEYQISGQYLSKLEPAYAYNSVKTQPLSSMASNPQQVIKHIFYPEISSWTPAEPMSPWLYHEGGDYKSSGSDFVNWCQTDDNGNLVLGEGYTVYTTNIYGETVAMQINKDVDGSGIQYSAVSDNLGIDGGYFVNEDGEGLKNAVEAWPGEINIVARKFESGKTIGPSDGSRLSDAKLLADVSLDAIGKGNPGYDEAYQIYEEGINAYNDLVSKAPALGTKIPISTAMEGARVALGTTLMATMPGSNTYNYFNSINTPTAEENTNLTKGDAVLKAHLHTILETAIPDTSKPQNADGIYPPLLNSDGKIIHYLDTQSTLTQGLSLDKATEDWALLIEPIMWLTIFHKGDTNKPAIHTKIYGTISNIADAFCIEPELKPYSKDAYSTFNWKAYQPAWGALTVGEKGYDFQDSTGNTLLHLAQPDGVGIATPFLKLHEMNTTTPNAEGIPQRIGYGVNVYDKKGVYGDDTDTSLIRTWDRENYPDGTPGPAPDATDDTQYPQETEFGDQSKKFNIVKWYTVAYTDTDGTEKEMVVDVQARKETPHTVVIENEYNEDSDYIWEVKKWSTGKDAIAPADGDTSTTFEQYHKMNPSTSKRAGICPDILYLTPEDKDSIVYVKLTAQQKLTRTDSNLTIVKVKDHQDGTTTVETIPGTPIDNKYNASDPGWDYLEDIQSPDPSTQVTTWADVPQTGTPGATPNITVDPNTKTLYIHYQQSTPPPAGKTPLVLHQNELSHGYTLKSLIANNQPASLQESFASMGGPVNLCHGNHREWCDNCEEYHYYSGTSREREMDDYYYTLSLTSSNTSPNFILDYQQDGNTWELTGLLGIKGGLTQLLTPNAKFMVYRDKQKDLVTPYPGKNTDRNLLNKLGIGADSAVPRPRINTVGSGKFYNNFKTNFSKSPRYDNTLGWKWYCDYYRSYEASGTWNGVQVAGHTISDINKAYSYDNNIETRYELGQTGTGTTQPEAKRADDFVSVFYNNPFVSVQKDGDIQFYPYTKMEYNDIDNSEANKKDVYVTSTNTSTISAFTKIESGVWKNGYHDDKTNSGQNPDPNVALNSTQWSTHKNSMDFLKEVSADDKKSVLPGGATYDVSMKLNSQEWGGPENDRPTTSTKLGYRVWQTCVDDTRGGLLAPGSTAPLLSEAKQKVNEFDQSIKDILPTYGLVQTVMKGAIKYNGYLGNYLNNGTYEVVTSGGNWNGIPLSTDAKYYLKLLDNKGQGQDFNSTVSNFDILKGGIVSQKLYTIGSDTQGEVYVQLDGTEIGRIHATEGIDKLLAQSLDIQLLDTSTKAVTNYINAIDRNRGQDQSGKAWYNEAFDGINVLYTYLSYDVGFGNGLPGSPGANGNGTEKRSAVLDPKLTGRLDSKSDLYNFSPDTEGDKVRSSMFLTGQTGVANGLTAPTGELGTLSLKSGGTIIVKLNDMREFAFSKVFYIPNANVTDLN